MVAFKQVDVFTTEPYKGNPVAVIMDASALSGEQMQTIAGWTNLSETTFVLPPGDGVAADYRVRIFTPKSELPFAGHPTIGTAHALLEAGLVSPRAGRLVQQCGAGLVPLAVDASTGALSFELPPPAISPLDDADVDALERALGCPVNRALRPAVVDVGPRWVVASTADAAAVLATAPDFAALARLAATTATTGVSLYGAYGDGEPDADIEVRSFAPSCGVDEDPVCGSGNGSVAAFLRHHRVVLPAGRPLRSSQGSALRRAGRLALHVSPARILVGGHAVTCIDGHMAAPAPPATV